MVFSFYIKKMKKIALYIDVDFQGSGVSQYNKALLNALIALSSKNRSITVIYTRKCWENHVNRFPQIKSVFLKNNKLLNQLYQLFISIGLHFIAKKIAQNLDSRVAFIENNIFDFIIFPSGDTIACLVNSNVICTIHDLMHRYERRFKESGNYLIYHYRENYYKNLLLSATIVLVDSNLGKKQVIDSYTQITAKIFSLPYIAPDYIYSQNISPPNESRQAIYNRRYLFYPAVFWSHKNHINLILAIKILKERGQEIDLLLGGKKQFEYRKLLKLVIEENLEENIKFLGYVSDKDVIDLYKNAFAMVMPTFYGPTNIPPIEAILLNCPPIVSNNYGMPEQFEDAAIYFNPYSPLQIADAIESLLGNNDLRNCLLKNGEKIKEKFSQNRFEADLKNILEYLDQN